MPASKVFTSILTSILLIAANPTQAKESTQEVKCLATAIHYEARGEKEEGRRAVANVIINRKDSGRFPDTVCAVIKQKGQFSFWPKPLVKDEKKIEEARHYFANPIDNTNKALFFHSKKVKPAWKKTLAIKIGNHLFYR